jgi:hypothetical protein
MLLLILGVTLAVAVLWAVVEVDYKINKNDPEVYW